MLDDQTKNLRNIAIGVMFLGIILFLVGIVLSIKMLYIDKKNSKSVEGTVIAITDNSTYVEYKVNGRIYKKNYHVKSSNYYVGKKVKIYYKSFKPQDSFISGIRYLILIVPFVGLIIMGVSGIIFMYIYMKYYKI